MRFVETPIFTKVINRLLDDEAYRALQVALMLRPEQGSAIGGARGARKLRWARSGTGKRSGIRVIYYWAPADAAFYMLYAYAKNEQSNITPVQARVLGQLIREEFQ
ncbi:MAG: hypothetical protein A3H91_13780 [Gammaproteobacteria bacterium RIFCSPLOWO2_02_FULL_61_13]|nr:MAG: hypothetical protein A3H91_13780 [Gammaproteobacteria bacterium RIFCSPLOWO2_02_FULL_61_13]